MLETLKEVEAAATMRPWSLGEQGYIPEINAIADHHPNNVLIVHLRNLAPEILLVIDAAMLLTAFAPDTPEPFRDALEDALEAYRLKTAEYKL